jgi:hypothetical protein
MRHAGVSREGLQWTARTYFQSRQRVLGRFDTEEEAARAYDQEAARVWVNPILNFLPDGSTNPDRNSRTGSRTLVPRPDVEPSGAGGGGGAGAGGGRGRPAKAKGDGEKRVSSFRGG